MPAEYWGAFCRRVMSGNRNLLLTGLASGLVALCALGVYLRTLSPSITWAHDGADSGDLAAAVACRGVPHPTGYPTYLLAGELWMQVPWGDVAYRLNLLSAAAGAASGGLMVLLAAVTLRGASDARPTQDHTGLRRAIPGASAGLILAFSPLLWSQAVIAEVYTLHLLFLLLLVLLGVWNHHRKSDWVVGLLFGLFGLGLGNHLSLAMVLPALFVLLWSDMGARPFRFLLSTALGIGLGLCVYVVIPWRAAQVPPINWGGASDLEGFWWLVSGQAYRGLVLGLPFAHLPARVAVGLRILVVGLGGWGFPFAILGVIGLWERNRRLAASTLLVFVGYSLYAVLYDTTDSYVYLLPAVAMAALWMAHGLHSILELVLQHEVPGAGLSRLRFGVSGVVIGLSLIGLPWHWAAPVAAR